MALNYSSKHDISYANYNNKTIPWKVNTSIISQNNQMTNPSLNLGTINNNLVIESSQNDILFITSQNNNKKVIVKNNMVINNLDVSNNLTTKLNDTSSITLNNKLYFSSLPVNIIGDLKVSGAITVIGSSSIGLAKSESQFTNVTLSESRFTDVSIVNCDIFVSDFSNVNIINSYINAIPNGFGYDKSNNVSPNKAIFTDISLDHLILDSSINSYINFANNVSNAISIRSSADYSKLVISKPLNIGIGTETGETITNITNISNVSIFYGTISCDTLYYSQLVPDIKLNTYFDVSIGHVSLSGNYIPASNMGFNIGSTNYKFNEIISTNFIGNLSGEASLANNLIKNLDMSFNNLNIYGTFTLNKQNLNKYLSGDLISIVAGNASFINITNKLLDLSASVYTKSEFDLSLNTNITKISLQDASFVVLNGNITSISASVYSKSDFDLSLNSYIAKISLRDASFGWLNNSITSISASVYSKSDFDFSLNSYIAKISLRDASFGWLNNSITSISSSVYSKSDFDLCLNRNILRISDVSAIVAVVSSAPNIYPTLGYNDSFSNKVTNTKVTNELAFPYAITYIDDATEDTNIKESYSYRVTTNEDISTSTTITSTAVTNITIKTKTGTYIGPTEGAQPNSLGIYAAVLCYTKTTLSGNENYRKWFGSTSGNGTLRPAVYTNLITNTYDISTVPNTWTNHRNFAQLVNGRFLATILDQDDNNSLALIINNSSIADDYKTFLGVWIGARRRTTSTNAYGITSADWGWIDGTYQVPNGSNAGGSGTSTVAWDYSNFYRGGQTQEYPNYSTTNTSYTAITPGFPSILPSSLPTTYQDTDSSNTKLPLLMSSVDGTIVVTATAISSFNIPFSSAITTYSNNTSEPSAPVSSSSVSYLVYTYEVNTTNQSREWHRQNAINLGRSLAVISNPLQNEQVRAIITDWTFIGGRRKVYNTNNGSSSAWEWTNGDPWAYTNWDSGEPGTNEDSVKMYTNGKWHDWPGTSTGSAVYMTTTTNNDIKTDTSTSTTTITQTDITTITTETVTINGNTISTYTGSFKISDNTNNTSNYITRSSNTNILSIYSCIALTNDGMFVALGKASDVTVYMKNSSGWQTLGSPITVDFSAYTETSVGIIPTQFTDNWRKNLQNLAINFNYFSGSTTSQLILAFGDTRNIIKVYSYSGGSWSSSNGIYNVGGGSWGNPLTSYSATTLGVSATTNFGYFVTLSQSPSILGFTVANKFYTYNCTNSNGSQRGSLQTLPSSNGSYTNIIAFKMSSDAEKIIVSNTYYVFIYKWNITDWTIITNAIINLVSAAITFTYPNTSTTPIPAGPRSLDISNISSDECVFAIGFPDILIDISANRKSRGYVEYWKYSNTTATRLATLVPRKRNIDSSNVDTDEYFFSAGGIKITNANTILVAPNFKFNLNSTNIQYSLNTFTIFNNFFLHSSGFSSSYTNTAIATAVIAKWVRTDSPSTQPIEFRGNGDLKRTSQGIFTVSDIRLKENIVDVTPKLLDLLKVRVVNYNLKGSDGIKLIGVVAQELEQIFPTLVNNGELSMHDIYLGKTESYKSVKYSCFDVILIKAFQEQMAIINKLTSQLDEIECKTKLLKAISQDFVILKQDLDLLKSENELFKLNINEILKLI